MESANAAEMGLLQVKVDVAKSRLKRAQLNLTSVLNLLTDLPEALKTGVMRAIETAFEDLGEAEKYVSDMEDIVRAKAPGSAAPGDRCPHCSRLYADVSSTTPSVKTGSTH